MSPVHKVNKNGWGTGRGVNHTRCAAGLHVISRICMGFLKMRGNDHKM